ncbi:MAG TPA: CDP-alcohol phosphatidyltransferase family protein [Anaerolineae bacterium]|nr:CDP-alcohol phosphatidyltransferase family protein [Anaerolineae bacterium]
MIEALRKPANIATAVRFFSIPVLWVFAFLGNGLVLGIGLVIASLTDSVDGALARKLDHVSSFGSKFDSIADHTLQLSAVVWLGMLRPEVFIENPFLVWTALGMNLFSLLFGLVKFRRLANLHLYTSKAVYPLFVTFVAHAFIFGQYSKVLLYIACIGIIVAYTEAILLQIVRNRVDEHIGSILFLYLDENHPLQRFAPKRSRN